MGECWIEGGQGSNCTIYPNVTDINWNPLVINPDTGLMDDKIDNYILFPGIVAVAVAIALVVAVVWLTICLATHTLYAEFIEHGTRYLNSPKFTIKVSKVLILFSFFKF